ncbi:MAG: NAD(P)/FAD-dependent oxidoreductase [Clostridia bacterium]|nr:NAD(P)/FAD-dependent oxidoreductase [Clostridia bacterium]
MKNIVVIGANQCGLAFAKFAADAGFDVNVYEAKQRDEVAYNWTDDMMEETFPQVGLPLPPEEIHTRKRSWTFIPPSQSVKVFVPVPEEELDFAMYRRPFNAWLEELATKAGAKVHFGTKVDRMLIEGGKAVGVMLADGTKVDAGLVVDCGGVNSPIRNSLPDDFGIEQRIDPNDTFVVRRTFFRRPEGTKRPEFTNCAYLKHLGENGISWCLLSYDEQAADVLIGRLGKLTDARYTNALADLRRDNPIIGKEIVTGGELLQIPVRHPIATMVSNGYALVGDSAYMTIPMLGSGMAAGMRAGRMLADVIAEPIGDPFSVENLYRYQKQYMKEIGAEHSAINMMKNWLLKTDDRNVDFLIGKGIVNKKMLVEASAGHMLRMTFPELVSTALRGIKRLDLLLELAALMGKMEKQLDIAANMPEQYDKEALKVWRQNYEKAFQ